MRKKRGIVLFTTFLLGMTGSGSISQAGEVVLGLPGSWFVDELDFKVIHQCCSHQCHVVRACNAPVHTTVQTWGLMLRSMAPKPQQ